MGTIERKGSENLAKSGATGVDPSNLGQSPRVGVGLRPTHYSYLLEHPKTSVRWFEAISENYIDSEGRPLEMLEFIRKDYPVALHGVSLSIASAEGLRSDYLQKLKRLKDHIEPFIVSDHLCWTGLQEANLHDLLLILLQRELVHDESPRYMQP